MILSRQRTIVGAATLLACSIVCDGLVPISSGQDSNKPNSQQGASNNANPPSETQPGNTPPAKKDAVGRPKLNNDTPVVLFPIKTGNAQDILKVLNEQFRGKVDVILLLDTESPPKLVVKGSPEIQGEIRGVIHFLENDMKRWPRESVYIPAPSNVNVAPKSANRLSVTAAPAANFTYPAPIMTGPAAGISFIQFQGSHQSLQGSHQPRLESALKKLRDAKTDDDKQAAKAALRKVLSAIFEEDMSAREKQAKEIEVRLAKLRQQYQERQKAANEILDLQVKSLENEAAGLGFPSGGPTMAPLPPLSPSATPPLPSPVSRTNSAPVALPQPMANNRAIEQFKMAYPTQERIGQLVKDGQIAGSPDGKMYAYVENTRSNTGVESVEIRVCDAATGKLMAVAKMLTPVGRLQFTDEGVATREADGTVILRVPLRKIGLIAPGS